MRDKSLSSKSDKIALHPRGGEDPSRRTKWPAPQAEQSIARGFLLHRDRDEVIDLAEAASVPQGSATNALIIPSP